MNAKPTRQFLRANPRLAVVTLFAAGAVFMAVFPAIRQGLAQREQAASAPEISASAMNQIAALVSEKLSRTSTQRKIDSQILATIRMRRDESVAPGVDQLQTDVEVTTDDRAKVDIRAKVTADLQQEIVRVGGGIIAAVPRFDAIRALIPLDQIEALAASPDVQFISRPVRAQTRVARSNDTSKAPSPLTVKGHSGSSFEERAERLRWQLPNLLSGFSGPGQRTSAATVVSEGDKTHRAAEARTMFGVDGSGVKIGVISDSVDNLSTSQAAGELGTVTVLPGQSGVNSCGDSSCSGEGTAMLEIIHDLAPGAQLYFATANISEASFAENILDLRAAGCNIIVDDVAYLDESPFQDGIVAQAVNAVTADGALYFSAAGNDGNLTDGTSSVWEGDFANGGQISVGGQSITVHSFGSAVYNSLTSGGQFCNSQSCTGLVLFWSDSLGQSASDYDLYVLDSSGTSVLRKSDNFQTGSQDPFESIAPLFQSEKIVIVRTNGAARFLHLGAVGLGPTTLILNFGTSGVEFGHATATNCIGVAAVPAASPFPSPIGTGTNPAGPFPNPFTAANHIERFNSDGPRRVFYNSDGTAITPGNVSATGGTLRQKPDIAAADGVSTSFPSNSGLNPFFGTSAAAPHAAAIAALLKSFAPTMTAAEIRSVLKTTAIDIESAGADRDSGSGIVMAVPALQSVATGVNLSTTTGPQTVTQGQNAVYTITINRRNFAGTVNLALSGLPAGASASFNPGSTTGNTSTLTVTTNSATTTGIFVPSVTATASGVTIFPLSLGLTVNPSCGYSISPSARNFDLSGGSASIAVSAASGCVWTATATESWITINSGSSGNGGGTINYSVAANSGGARSGRILVANQTFVIAQAGNNPTSGAWVPASRMRVARRGFSMTVLQNGKVLVAGGLDPNSSTTRFSSSELYDPSTGTWSDTGNLNTARSSHNAVLLQNGSVLVVGGYVGTTSSGLPTQTAEIFNPATGSWTNTGSMTMVRGGFSVTLLPNGKVLVAGGFSISSGSTVLPNAELYDPTTGAFVATGDMKFATADHEAVLMQNGKVLSAGGFTDSFVTSSSQTYDPATGAWSNAPTMNAARLSHRAIVLANGKVLVAGGERNSGTIQNSADLFDPATGNWTAVASMNDERESFTATLLQNGKVLVSGGNGNFFNWSTAELFDPASGRWSRTGGMSVDRYDHSAVPLSNGKVLVAGGTTINLSTPAPPEIFDPGFTGNWSLTGSMIAARWDHTANLLNNGNVLVAGGNGANGILNTAELYDYTAGLWRSTGSLVVPRRNHTATLLSNGKVLVVGGNNGLLTLKSAELYDPNTGAWTTTGDMLLSRSSHAATLLPNGTVLVTGGNSPTAPTNTAEIYDPATGSWSSAPNMIQPRSAHTATLMPSGIVLVVGAYDGSFPTGETFNPAAGLWTASGGFRSRSGHTATLLPNGGVLLAGGVGTPFDSDVFTPGSPFVSSPGMMSNHFFHASALLLNGRVLVAGGDEGDVPGTTSCELYDRESNSFIRTADLIAAREFQTATLLPNGKVLVGGGVGSAGALSSAEVYDASPGCSFALSQNGQNVPNAGGSGNVNVTAGAGCLWSAVSNATFITVAPGTDGVGNGTVNFSVATNSPGNSRTGTITIADKTFTITQASDKTLQFSSANYTVSEGSSRVDISVSRSGDTTSSASAGFATSDAAGLQNCNVLNGRASSRCDYITHTGTVQFAAGETSKTIPISIIDDGYVEGPETFTISLSNPGNATLGTTALATVTITDNDSVTGANPLDQQRFFVQQHYYDFLGRFPDQAGWDFWTSQITNCGANQGCIDASRVSVSASFFLSIEFQQTGYLVERIYKASYSDTNGTSTFPSTHQLSVPIIRFGEFLPDTGEISNGVIVGQGDWQTQLENNKQAFVNEFVQRSRFTTAFPTTMTPAQFVDRLFNNAGVTPIAADRMAAINEFGGAATTTDTAARGRALRRVAENSTLNTQEFNRAFVLMQYYGYLRRDPNSGQDTDYSGYDFWLTKLNQFNGNYINAEMVKAFITSIEYRQRVGP
jgi:Subtilase family/Calx-beta domain/Galactose oxidase, central domain/Kelch motif/Viral BACON domain